MAKLTIMLGKVFEDDKWAIALNASDGRAFSFFCEPCEETIPYYGKVFEDDEIKELIIFLHQTVFVNQTPEGKEADVKNNLE